MNQIIKTILIISIAVFSSGLLFVSSTQATEMITPLVVEFEDEPLFHEADFKPGDGITRWVKITNYSGKTQRIATEAINESDPNNFASQLNLTIKEGLTTIFNKTLAEFFSQGETYLSSLANGAMTQYDFTITFDSGAENYYQGRVLGFDILVGFEGTEGGLPLPLPGGGGGGGGLPPGLTIQDESVRVTTTTEVSVTIVWTTSYLSTSQVIYAKKGGEPGEPHTLDLTDNTGTPPKYGYAHTTPEYDVSPKVTLHSVTISGLTPDTQYYFRAVSHASLAISVEHSFTTLGVKTEAATTKEETTEEGAEEGTGEQGGEIIEEFVREGPSQVSEEGGEIVGEEGEEELVTTEGGKAGLEGGIFLAAIGNIFNQGNLWWILILALVIIIVLFLFSKKRRRKNQ